MKRLLFLTLMVFPLPVAAQECGSTWTARMLESEGGQEMTGEVCTASGEEAQMLNLTCGGDMFSLRWYPPQDLKNYPPDGNPDFKTTLTLSIGGVRIEHEALFEAMDGAMAVYWKKDDILTQILKSGRSLLIEEKEGRLPSAHFSLSGSLSAIETVAKACMS